MSINLRSASRKTLPISLQLRVKTSISTAQHFERLKGSEALLAIISAVIYGCRQWQRKEAESEFSGTRRKSTPARDFTGFAGQKLTEWFCAKDTSLGDLN